MQDHKGFSLIELLVVVAIIGVLAIAGLVAYTQYINSVKDEAVVSDGREIQREIETGLFAARVGLSSGRLIGALRATASYGALVDEPVENANIRQLQM